MAVNLRNVHVYIKAGTDFRDPLRPGYYKALLVDVESGQTKKLDCSLDEDTTQNRLMILAAIEAIKHLKYPCKVVIHTTTAIGLKKGGGINKGLLSELKSIAEKGNHDISNDHSHPEYIRSIILKYFSE